MKLEIRGTLCCTLYRKMLGSLINENSNNVITLFTIDVNKIKDFPENFHGVWSLPFQLLLSLYLLYQQLGLVALVGIVFTLGIIVISRYLAKYIHEAKQKMLKANDQRVKLLSNVFNNITGMKMSGYENLIHERTLSFRQQEFKNLKSIKYLDAGCVFFWASTPVMISVTSFLLFKSIGFINYKFEHLNENNESNLTLGKIFTSLGLINMLIGPMNSIPWVIAGFAESFASFKRVALFLKSGDLNYLEYYEGLVDSFREILKFEKASFRYAETGNDENDNGNDLIREIPENTLTDISFSVNQNEKIGIYGPIGCGKSSLLKSILAELEMTSGKIRIQQTLENSKKSIFIAYCPQNPFIFNSTIFKNVSLFSSNLNTNVNDQILARTCLNKVNLTDKNLNYICGENGSKLSGGQKVKLSLARALYQIEKSSSAGNYDCSILLIDEPFGATDKETHQIITKIIKNLNLAVICCTHETRYIEKFADKVIEMNKFGQIYEISGVEKLKAENVLGRISVTSKKSDEVRSDQIMSSSTVKTIEDSDEILQEQSEIERDYTQKLDKSVPIFYAKSIGWFNSFLIIFSLLAMQMSRIASDFFVAVSTEEKGKNVTLTNGFNLDSVEGPFYYAEDIKDGTNKTTDQFLIIYSSLGITNIFLTLARAFIFAYGGLQACQIIFKNFLNSIILKSNLSFFSQTNSAQILTRLTTDTMIIDDNLPFILNILLANFATTISTIVLSIYVFPPVIFVIIILAPYYLYIFKVYRVCSRSVRRQVNESLSPVIDLFENTFKGISSIRAYRKTQIFKNKFLKNLNSSQKSMYWESVSNIWCSIRLQLVAVAIVSTIILLSCLAHQMAILNHINWITPLTIGLTLSYSLSLANSISDVCRTLAETEREFVSLERVTEFNFEKLQEKDFLEQHTEQTSGGSVTDSGTIGSFFPSNFLNAKTGSTIEIKNLNVSYDQKVTDDNGQEQTVKRRVLKNFNLNIERGECVGIVGPNGSGKTTLVKALLKLVRRDTCNSLSSSCILIDDYDINSFNGRELRERIAVVSQEPFIFNVGVEENIRYFYKNSDYHDNLEYPTEVLRVLLDQLNLQDASKNDKKESLSQGQRQLVAFMREIYRIEVGDGRESNDADFDYEDDDIARILLNESEPYSNQYGLTKTTNLLILDEPTSFLDSDTENRVCEVLKMLRAKYNLTILLIAHKAVTIERLCDRIVEMEGVN